MPGGDTSGRNARRPDDHRHSDRLLDELSLIEEVVASKIVSVIGCEDNQRIVEDSGVGESSQHATEQVIGTSRRCIVVGRQVAQIEARRKSVCLAVWLAEQPVAQW